MNSSDSDTKAQQGIRRVFVGRIVGLPSVLKFFEGPQSDHKQCMLRTEDLSKDGCARRTKTGNRNNKFTIDKNAASNELLHLMIDSFVFYSRKRLGRENSFCSKRTQSFIYPFVYGIYIIGGLSKDGCVRQPIQVI
jgi:hypothetical protein